MKRTGRTLVILMVAVWLAALTPTWATSGPAAKDPVRIGIGIGGDLIDALGLGGDENGDGHGDENGDGNGDGNGGGTGEGNGDGNGGGNGDGNGDEGETGGLLREVRVLLFGDSDGDDDENRSLVGEVRVLLFGDDETVDSFRVVATRPADDDGLVEDVVEALNELELEDLEPFDDIEEIVEDVVDRVLDTVDVVVCITGRFLEDVLPPPTTTTTAPVPPATSPPPQPACI